MLGPNMVCCGMIWLVRSDMVAWGVMWYVQSDMVVVDSNMVYRV